MKIVVIESSYHYGGIEVVAADLIRYLVNIGNEVYLITTRDYKDKKNVYLQMLCDMYDKLNIVFVDHIEKVSMYHIKRYKNDIQKINDTFNDFQEELRIVTFYFRTEQYAKILFERFKNTYELFVWPHPLEFVFEIATFSKEKLYYPRKKNAAIFRYQAKLLQKLDDEGGCFYSSRSIYDFNRWYYDVDLRQDKRIEVLPVRTIFPNKKYYYDYLKNKLNILWVGRFDFWKNEAIVYIYKCLSQLQVKHKGIMINFNIVGGGDKASTDDLTHKLIEKNVNINFLGLKKPDELPDIYVENDIGIAMGLTVKQMAMCGLPAILIDTLTENFKPQKCCNWIFDTSEGDAGDGFYYSRMGSPLKCRQNLYDILEKVTEDPNQLNEISNKCREFVIKYYSINKQNKVIVDRLVCSQKKLNNEETFRHLPHVRAFYKLCLGVRKIIK